MPDGGTVHFSVLYADGIREVNVGTIAVNPAALSFKRLLSLLSQKIGVAPHQFSVYLASVGTDLKIPLNPKVNLTSTIPPGGGAAGYYFFIVRRVSSRRSKKPPAAREKNIQPDNVMLLRRAAAESNLASFRPAADAAVSPFADRVEYDMRMLNLRMERERFLMNMAINDRFSGREASNGAAYGIERFTGGIGGGERFLNCEDCLRGNNGGFHPCVNDDVTIGFRSSAGPISRPPTESVLDGGLLLSRDKLERGNSIVHRKREQ